MNAIEIILVLFLTIFTIFGVSAMAYFMVLMPIKDDIADIREEQKRVKYSDRLQKHVGIIPQNPTGMLPSIDDLPESVWNADDFGNYGEDILTPEEVEEEMSNPAPEPEQNWQDLEDHKHGKNSPLFYTG